MLEKQAFVMQSQAMSLVDEVQDVYTHGRDLDTHVMNMIVG